LDFGVFFVCNLLQMLLIQKLQLARLVDGDGKEVLRAAPQHFAFIHREPLPVFERARDRRRRRGDEIGGSGSCRRAVEELLLGRAIEQCRDEGRVGLAEGAMKLFELFGGGSRFGRANGATGRHGILLLATERRFRPSS
jgi:hypothetical protein